MVNALDLVKWGAIVLAIVALVAAVASAAGTVAGLASSGVSAMSEPYSAPGSPSDLSITRDVLGATFTTAAARVVGHDATPGLLAALGGMFTTVVGIGLALLVYRFVRQIFS